MIGVGTWVAAAGAAAMFLYAVAGGTSPLLITAAFVPVGIGLGLRGPPGFYRAVQASRGDDARGAALVVLAIMASAAGGTAFVAPFIERGLVPLAAASLVLQAGAVACLLLLPKLEEPARAA
jgi:MFS transporter, DHA1 family, multidrug resistance protein